MPQPNAPRKPSGHYPVAHADVLHGFPDLVAVVDRDGVIVYTSPSSRHLLGRAPALITGRHAWEYVAPEDRRITATWFNHATTSEDSQPLRHRLVHADGGARLFETRVGRTPSGRYTGRVVAVCRDMSAQSAVERQIESMSELWREVCHQVAEGVVLLTDTGVVLAANPAAERLLRRRRAELVGAEIDSVVEPSPGFDRAGGSRWWQSRQRITAAITDGRPLELMEIESVGTASASDALALIIRAQTPEARATGRSSTWAALGSAATLSPREHAVLQLLSDGYDVRAIADELGISVHTTRLLRQRAAKETGCAYPGAGRGNRHKGWIAGFVLAQLADALN